MAYVPWQEFNEYREKADDRHARLEDAMRQLEQDWIDTQRLLPTHQDIEDIKQHLGKQDWILWSIAIAVIAGLIVSIAVLK